MSNHTVNKISLLLPASDYNQAREHQASAKHWANHSLPILLNEYFESINNSDELIYLDKIEINLPDFPWKIPDDVWKQKIQAGIKMKASTSETFSLIFKQWQFYLHHGCFEYDAILKNLGDSEKYVFSNWKYLTERLIDEVRRNNISSNFLSRLFFQHSQELTILFIEKLLGVDHTEAEKITSILKAETSKNADLVQQMISHLVNLINQQKIREKDKIVEALVIKQNTSSTKSVLANLVGDKTSPQNSRKSNLDDVSITCTNVGLVLLFPYLKLFFENNALLENNEFINAAAKQTAIQALYFLATGKHAGEEAEYIIPKLLCGIEPDEYIELDSPLNEPIKAEADELLQAVIDYWKVLQNTSIDGLREAFLQRNGKLFKKGDQYILQVAESGVDILLNNIPWGFRNYRLPWMPFTMITEWY